MNVLIIEDEDKLSGYRVSGLEQEGFTDEPAPRSGGSSLRAPASACMRHGLGISIVAAIALTLLIPRLALSAGQLVRYVGDSLPPFTLSDTDGELHAIPDYFGNVILVNFWATWCAPCIREMPSMERLAERLAESPFTLLAVNAGEEPDVVNPFLERLELDLTVLLDQDGTAGRDWGVFAYPTTVLLDPDGKATWIVRGEFDWESPAAIAAISSMLPSDSEGASKPEPLPKESLSVAIDAGNVEGTSGLAEPRSLPPIVARGAREPDLAVDDHGTVIASWLEASGATSAALRVAHLGTDGWLEPVTVASGSDWFVNWADFPSLSRAGDSELAVTWSVLNGQGLYGYDLNIARSTDGGLTWNAPVVPHRDGTPTQHGLASMAPLDGGRLLVTWLDGRVNARAGDTSRGADLPTDDMTLRSAIINADGVLEEQRLLDDRVCSCCGTASVALPDGGALVAYRDRSANEVRDIAMRRLRNGRWERSQSLHVDGWRIAGCPINGPTLAAESDRVAVAWFTAANDAPEVRLAFSDDGGDGFDPPIRVDDGRPIGRTDVELLADGSALVSWLEASDLGEELRVRRITRAGERLSSQRIAHSNRGRTMGFPRMVRADEGIVIAWTVPDSGGVIGSAILSSD